MTLRVLKLAMSFKVDYESFMRYVSKKFNEAFLSGVSQETILNLENMVEISQKK